MLNTHTPTTPALATPALQPAGTQAPAPWLLRFCGAHNQDGHHIDFHAKRCEFDGCEKQPRRVPIFGSPGDRVIRVCKAHKEDDSARPMAA